MKQRGVHLIANLSCGHASLNVIEDLANFFTCVQRLRPPGYEFEQSSIRRNDRSVARPFVNAINAIHDYRGRIDLNADQIWRQSFVVKKLKLRLFPDEQIVDDFQRARAQDLGDFFLTDEPARCQNLPEQPAGLALDFHRGLKLRLFDLTVMQQYLAEILARVI